MESGGELLAAPSPGCRRWVVDSFRPVGRRRCKQRPSRSFIFQTGSCFFVAPFEDSHRMCLSRFIVSMLISVLAATFVDANPPQAPEKPHEITEAGHARVDPFFWLREKADSDVLKYLKAENQYAESALKHTEKLQDTIYHEMRGRIKEDDVSVPQKIDDYYYYSRTETGKQY